MTKEQRREMEGDPLIFIVTVLIFYSCGIAILMINYMKKVTSLKIFQAVCSLCQNPVVKPGIFQLDFKGFKQTI